MNLPMFPIEPPDDEFRALFVGKTIKEVAHLVEDVGILLTFTDGTRLCVGMDAELVMDAEGVGVEAELWTASPHGVMSPPISE